MIVTCQAETNGGNTKAQDNFNYEISSGDSIMIEELHRSEFMADQQIKECQTEFTKATPDKPWDNQSVAKFEPLINLIEAHTQSDMFRRQGKYAGNGDYYEIAREMDDADKTSDSRTFPNGVKVQVEEADGWPTKLVLEDEAAGRKETVTFNDTNHTITSTVADYCGVSRERKFGLNGEYYRAYHFAGGTVEKAGALPVLKLDGGDKQ
jgi:hypothetical protein